MKNDSVNKDRILLIGEDESAGEKLKKLISDLNFNIISASDAETGLELVKKMSPSLIITDYMLPDGDGLYLLKEIKKIDFNVPVIIITAQEKMDSAIEAMQLGAYDYIEKPLKMNRLKIIIFRALETNYLSKKLEAATSVINNENEDEYALIGKSQAMKDILKNIGQVSSSRVNVLIQGESGTGKELISRVIHFSGITKDQPFIAVNSASLSETLLESELFGHEKGAFTGAIRSKKGKFELGGEGTVFLDEISEISPNLQSKLLRVIQEKEFERVGGEETVKMKARIIAATNKNLKQLVNEGKFREDLFYRLNVFTINVPPLRERKEDIPNLAVHLLIKLNRQLHKNVVKIPYEVIDMLQNYEWVGNVRELENTILQGILLAKGEVLEKANILLRPAANKSKSMKIPEDLSLAAVEKEHIRYVLTKANWDKKEAARLLQISRQTLYNKIKAYSLYPTY